MILIFAIHTRKYFETSCLLIFETCWKLVITRRLMGYISNTSSWSDEFLFGAVSALELRLPLPYTLAGRSTLRPVSLLERFSSLFLQPFLAILSVVVAVRRR